MKEGTFEELSLIAVLFRQLGRYFVCATESPPFVHTTASNSSTIFMLLQNIAFQVNAEYLIITHLFLTEIRAEQLIPH